MPNIHKPFHQKYRQNNLDELVGQKFISITLKQALLTKKIAPAYLFNGPRGTGKTSLVMGKHSGRHAFKDKLSDLGYTDLTDDVIQNAFGKFKILADKKKHVYDEDILALVDDSLIVDNKINAINLKSLKVFAGTGEPQKAEMTLDVFWWN